MNPDGAIRELEEGEIVIVDGEAWEYRGDGVVVKVDDDGM